MQVAFSNQIHWKNNHLNAFEEYCAVLPKLCGKKVKHFKQIAENKAVSCTAHEINTAKKIAILLSHFTLIIPLVMYVGREIQRRVADLKVTPKKVHPEHLETAKEIRRLREDSNYVPAECKGLRHSLRLNLPADSILEELYPERFKQTLAGFPFFMGEPLDTETGKKQDLILSDGCNGFKCVHGVENAKGGIKNLLNMLLEGVIRAPYTGGLMHGMPEFVAGPHGPFYVILDPMHANAAYRRKGLWNLDAQVAFLVPREEDRICLEKGLAIAVERGYITQEEMKIALEKVITYDEFIALPKILRHSETLLKAHLA